MWKRKVILLDCSKDVGKGISFIAKNYPGNYKLLMRLLLCIWGKFNKKAKHLYHISLKNITAIRTYNS